MPKVITTSVIRSAHPGESHGGVYIVDVDASKCEQVIDWNERSISWEGRGLERGLRGIAFHGNEVYLAGSNELLIYTKNFELIGSLRNKYLQHCHEITIHNETLYLTSTGYDSILEFDLSLRSFTKGCCIRTRIGNRYINRLFKKMSPVIRWGERICLKPWIFDPNSDDGPLAGDTLHLNSVHVGHEAIYVAGTAMPWLLSIKNERVSVFAHIGRGTHNARPFRQGVLFNNTSFDRVALADCSGRILESFAVKQYEKHELQMAELPNDVARQAFARGLCVSADNLIIGGSSPATISVYKFGYPNAVKTVNISMDVRNSIHGLEIWPY
jgi:hypothetical protein